MTQEQAEILNRLFEDGYIIQIEASSYVTGNVYAIDKIEDTEDIGNYMGDDNIPINIGDYVYSDEIMDSRPLSEVFISEVKVLARVDWLRIMQGYDLPRFQDEIPYLQDWNDDLDKAYENN